MVIPLDVPQASVTFGGRGWHRSDPDFMAAYIVNHILGGGSFSSRLYREVREKRGLAYGVSDSLIWLKHAALLFGTTGHARGRDRKKHRDHRAGDPAPGAGRTLGRGIVQDENLPERLVRTRPRQLEPHCRPASAMQTDELGMDYIERRSSLIDAVTLADTKRVAKRLLESGLLVTVVGPAGRRDLELTFIAFLA